MELLDDIKNVLLMFMFDDGGVLKVGDGNSIMYSSFMLFVP